MNHFLDPIVDVWERSLPFSSQTINMTLKIIIVFLVILLVVSIWKCMWSLINSTDVSSDPKKSKNKKIEVSKFEYIWFVGILPLLFIVYLIFFKNI